jgi:hypothetical protein
MLNFLRVVRRPAVGGGADPDGGPCDVIGSDVRVLAEVDVAAVVALFADHLDETKRDAQHKQTGVGNATISCILPLSVVTTFIVEKQYSCNILSEITHFLCALDYCKKSNK